MAGEITNWQIQAYKEGVLLAVQQRRSKLRAAVRDDGKLVGKRVFFDLLAATSMKKRTVRNQPTVLTDQTHNRRAGSMDFYDLHMTVDPIDIHRIGSDPSSSYQQNGVMACERQIDDVIIAAMTGTAYEGEDGSTSVAFNAGGNALVANAGVGLTLDKILAVGELYESMDLPEDEPRYWAYGAAQRTDLLNINEIKSNDYNNKALVDGKVIYFAGFNWISHQRLGIPAGAGIRRNITWAKSGVGFFLGQNMMVDIGKRRDLSNVDQISITIDCGALRVEDEKVIAVDCVE
ncbi:MAG: hypothetical protein A2Z40_03175 [Deltaproteobacteria bacterium RBG_19FT_COMBO_60_16]|nr:MAG: hypothetical protein A2Z40_03175 [Deltaproteobacteria bacterium RBG_19FT_COMBO_60_16]